MHSWLLLLEPWICTEMAFRRRECVVPFFTFNGFIEQHGVAYVLDNGLPCCAIISRIFELAVPEDALEAARFRLAINARSKCLYRHLQQAYGGKKAEAGSAGNKAGVGSAGKRARAKGSRSAGEPKCEFSYESYFVKPLDVLQTVPPATAVIFQLEIFEHLRRRRCPSCAPCH